MFTGMKRRTLAAWRTRLLEFLIVSRRPDISKRLYFDINTKPDRFASLEDTKSPEHHAGKNVYGAAHDLRVLAVVLLLFIIFMVIFLALVIKYGYVPNNSDWGK